jgi:23S rRNA (uracil1939-C5)-methyltransferase
MERHELMRAAISNASGKQAAGGRGDVAVATIESLNHDSTGVARINGKVTFIDGALPGEEVRFRYHNKHDSYDSGVALEILRASPDRVTPPCPHFGTCGGCSLQHFKSEAQILAKQKILADNLARIGKVEPESWLAPLAGPAWHYRRRARLGIRLVPKKGGVLVGFREKRHSLIAPLESCRVLDRRTSDLLPAVKQLLGTFSCADRIPQLEIAAADNALALVFRHLVPLSPTDLGHLREFGRRENVRVLLQPGRPDSIQALWPESSPALFYRLTEFDVQLEFGPCDFIQINGALNAGMIHQALELLELGPTDCALDLFSGLGNFTLPMARRGRQVLGIEAEASLVARARSNAALNGLANAKFRAANLFDEATPEAPWQGFDFNKLLLDPPRSGAIEAIKRLAPPLPERIVYVSCHPATLARDSAYLVNVLGYRLAATGVVDMFPHTSHVESMATFVRS